MQEKKKVSILILSDIHYSNEAGVCRLGKKVEDDEYFQKFLNCLMKQQMEKNINIEYVLIAGDLVHEGKRTEYAVIKKYLDKLMEELNISSENVLVVPGNHDISRDALSDYCDQKDITGDDIAKQVEVKYSKFVDFFKEFKKEDTLDLSKVIFDEIYVKECNLKFLGINTNVKESFRKEDHYGYVDLDRLRTEIKRIDDKYKYIVVSHHSWTNDRDVELPTIKNAKNARELLSTYGINCFFYGHHHVNERKNLKDRTSDYQVLEIGSFSKEKLELIKFVCVTGEWDEVTLGNGMNEISLNMKGDVKENETEIECDTEFMVDRLSDSVSEEKESLAISISQNSDKYVELISKKKLYKEGHYHWSNGDKTLGWINVPELLGNIEILASIRKEFRIFYSERKGDINAIIGYGLEGNIIGSALTPFCVKENLRYFFHPSIHKNYLDEEKVLWNPSADISKIAMICEFMLTDEDVAEIIRNVKGFEKMTKISIFSLFYTDNDSSPRNYTDSIEVVTFSEKDETQQSKAVVEIDRYVVCKLEIKKCSRDEKSCPYYIKDLVDVVML